MRPKLFHVTEKYIKEELERHELFLSDKWPGDIYKPADFTNCILDGYDFSGKDLRFAKFDCASLVGAEFVGSILSFASFEGADLTDANFVAAIVHGADFENADVKGTLIEREPMACPSHGEFIGWKKAGYRHNRNSVLLSGCIVQLKIPYEAMRSSALTEKCRCSEAVVLGAFVRNAKGELRRLPDDTTLCSFYDSSFHYHVGDVIKPRYDFDPNRFNECSSGIHFFVDLEAAERY